MYTYTMIRYIQASGPTGTEDRCKSRSKHKRTKKEGAKFRLAAKFQGFFDVRLLSLSALIDQLTIFEEFIHIGLCSFSHIGRNDRDNGTSKRPQQLLIKVKSRECGQRFV